MSPEQRCSVSQVTAGHSAVSQPQRWLLGHRPITTSQRQGTGEPPSSHTQGRGLGMRCPWEWHREETGAWGDLSGWSGTAQGRGWRQLFGGDGKRALGILYYVSAPGCVMGTRWGSQAESQHGPHQLCGRDGTGAGDCLYPWTPGGATGTGAQHRQRQGRGCP